MDKGVKVKLSNGDVAHVEVARATLTGDHLGIHEAHGRKICFTPSGYICRVCGASGAKIQQIETRPLLVEIAEHLREKSGIIREFIL